MIPMTEYLLASEAMTGLCTEFLMSADRVFGLVFAALQPGRASTCSNPQSGSGGVEHLFRQDAAEANA